MKQLGSKFKGKNAARQKRIKHKSKMVEMSKEDIL